MHAAHETPSDETHYSALGNNLQIAYKSFIQDACRRLGHTRGLVSKQTECILQPQSMSHLCACTYCCGHAVLLLQVSHTNGFGYLFQVSPESADDTILRRSGGGDGSGWRRRNLRLALLQGREYYQSSFTFHVSCFVGIGFTSHVRVIVFITAQ